MPDGLIDRPTAQVSGYPARVLGQFLRDAVRGQVGVFGRLPVEHRAAVLEAVVAIWRAGEAWSAEVDAMSEAGRADIAAELAGASSEERIDVKEAARMLGVTERQARRLGPALGSRVGGRWLFDLAAVRAEVERRSA